jgi:hypothetical protein
MTEPTYGLIGRGRVATHMAHYLKLEQQRCLQWHREIPDPPEQVLAGADIFLLAINDDAIAPFLERHPDLRERPVVHFSGSLVMDGASGLHPLMTFGPDVYELTAYRAVPFVWEAGGLGFHEAFPNLVNPSWPLDPELKPLYHALCVLSGNFTTLVWAKAFEDFEHRLGLPREILLPYLERTCRNTAAFGGDALTGSLARGDTETVERDLRALAGDPYADVFEALTRVFELEEVKR